MIKLILFLAIALGYMGHVYANSDTYVVTIQFLKDDRPVKDKRDWASTLLRSYLDSENQLKIHRHIIEPDSIGNLLFQAIITGKGQVIKLPLEVIPFNHNYKVIPLDNYHFRVSYDGDYYNILKFPLKRSLLGILESNNFDFYQVVNSLIGESCFWIHQSPVECINYLAPYFWNQYPNMANNLWRKLEDALKKDKDYYFTLEAKIGGDFGHPSDLILDRDANNGRIGSIANIKGSRKGQIRELKNGLKTQREKRSFYKLLIVKNPELVDGELGHFKKLEALYEKLNEMDFNGINQLKTKYKDYFLLKIPQTAPMSDIFEIKNELQLSNLREENLYNFLLVLHLRMVGVDGKTITKLEYPINLNAEAIEKIEQLNFDGQKVLNHFFLANSGQVNDVWPLFISALAHGPLVYKKSQLENLKAGQVKKIEILMTFEGTTQGFHQRFSKHYIDDIIFDYHVLPLKNSSQKWPNHFPVLEVNSVKGIQKRLSKIFSTFKKYHKLSTEKGL